MLVHYILSSGTHPYNDPDDNVLEQNIANDNRTLTVSDCIAADMVERMLASIPDDRPTVECLCK